MATLAKTSISKIPKQLVFATPIKMAWEDVPQQIQNNLLSGSLKKSVAAFRLKFHPWTEYEPKHLLNKQYARDLHLDVTKYSSGLYSVEVDYEVVNHHEVVVAYTYDMQTWYVANTSDLSKFVSQLNKAFHKGMLLPLDWSNAISQHLHGNGSKLSTLAIKIRNAREDYPDLLIVPKKYRHAWRIMAEIKPETMSKFTSKSSAKLGSHGVFHGGIYRPKKSQIQSSWTIDRKIFTTGTYEAQGHKNNTYTVILEADLNKVRSRFIVNPDRIYDFTDSDYNDEREVISVGEIPLSRISYKLIGAASSKDPMRRLVERLQNKAASLLEEVT